MNDSECKVPGIWELLTKPHSSVLMGIGSCKTVNPDRIIPHNPSKL